MAGLVAAVEEDLAVSQQPEQQTEKAKASASTYSFKQYKLYFCAY
jgi:hypothetical protein